MATCAICIAAGCTVPVDGGIAELDSPLIVSTLRDLTDFPLEVCFKSTGDGTEQDRAIVRDAVMGAWAAVPGGAVSFTGWQTCVDDNTSGDLRFFLDSSVERASDLLRTLETTAHHSVDRVKYVALHEFGHELGVSHEHIHPDRPALDPTCDPNSNQTLQQYHTVLTTYDHDSIMNYCNDDERRPLSDKDKLLVQMAYPSSLAVTLRSRTGFYISSGLLVRRDSTVVTDWTARGALPAAYDANGAEIAWIPWDDGPTTTDLLGIEYPASRLPSYAQGLYVSFEDFRGQARYGLSGVVVDDRRHAALITAVIAGS